MAKGYRFASVVSMAVLDSLDRTSSNGRLPTSATGNDGWKMTGPIGQLLKAAIKNPP
ncbi:hypothetical protein D3C77_194100 [compost metagenome]